MLKGIPGSSGYGIGKVLIYHTFDPVVTERHCDAGHLFEQKESLNAALDSAKKELASIQKNLPPDKSAIFGAHIEILEDEAMLEDIKAMMEHDRSSAEWAVYSVYNTYIDVLKKGANEFMRQRADDLKDIRNRIIRNLRNEPELSLSALKEPVIVAAYDLLPSHAAVIDGSKVLGFLTETGGATSHAAILARGFGIPAVLGIPSLTKLLRDGQTAIADGFKGLVITDPDEEVLEQYRALKADYARDLEIDRKFLNMPSETKDGVKIPVSLNIGSSELPENAEFCDGIGLFRSEFLYMEKDALPDEQTQYAAYASVLRKMGGRPVILRTLDIGGDKTLPYIDLEKEQNPFLGNRAIRLCLSREALFRTQLRAALRASPHGNLNIMFPMIGSVEDFRKAKAVADSVWEELRGEGFPLERRVPLGIMVEIPAAALAADFLAKEADFASIGTNDLCQYAFAADRMNPAVAEYAHPLSAPMLRLIRQTVQAFEAQNKPVSVCGEMAGDKNAVHLLVGSGIRKLSVSASALGMVKRYLRACTVAECKTLFEKALNCATEKEVLELVGSFRRENGMLG